MLAIPTTFTILQLLYFFSFGVLVCFPSFPPSAVCSWSLSCSFITVLPSFHSLLHIVCALFLHFSVVLHQASPYQLQATPCHFARPLIARTPADLLRLISTSLQLTQTSHMTIMLSLIPPPHLPIITNRTKNRQLTLLLVTVSKGIDISITIIVN